MTQFVLFGKLGWLPDGERLPVEVDAPRSITRLYAIDSLLTGDFATFKVAVQHLAMPVVVLAYGSLAVVTRMVRGGMLEVLNQDYIRTARAKGLAQDAVVIRHALKNAMLPTVTSLGLQVGLLFSGAFLVETVFSWPGIGRYTIEAIRDDRLQRDHGDDADHRGDLRRRKLAGRHSLPLPGSKDQLLMSAEQLGTAALPDAALAETTGPSSLSGLSQRRGASQLRRNLKKYLIGNRLNLAGLCIVILFFFMAIFGEMLAPRDPYAPEHHPARSCWRRPGPT